MGVCVCVCVYVCVCTRSLQSCLILCSPMYCSPPGSSVHGILQARTLEWVAVFSSNAWKWKVKVKSPPEKSLPRGKLGLVLMGGAMLSKSLIQFSVEGQGCVPSLLFDLRPNYGGGNEGNGDLLQTVPCMHCYTQCPQPCNRPRLTQTSARDS